MSRKAVSLLIIAAIAACAYGLYTQLDRETEMRDLGWNRAARRNPYLAAELFLRRLDIDVQSHQRFDRLTPLPENGAVFVSDSRHVFSDRQIQELTQWVTKRGGHLIVAASAPDDEREDALLAAFDIVAQEVRVKSARAVVHADGQKADVPKTELTRMPFNGGADDIALHFLPTRKLHHPKLSGYVRGAWGADMYWAGDQQGTHFVHLKAGRGRLSVLSDGDLWRSGRIGQFDHALFLRLLVRDSDRVRLFYGSQMPPLAALAWRHAWPSLIASALWLAAWLVYRGRRFGPIVEQQITVRRSLDEHVVAEAHYLWRGGWRRALVQPLQDDIQRQARRLAPHEELDESTWFGRLSESSGAPQWRVEDAMRSAGRPQEHLFTETIQCLQQIRKSL